MAADELLQPLGPERPGLRRLAPPRIGLPALRATMMLDAAPSKEAIDGKLAELEKAALKNGVALGVATALPVSIERLAAWSRTLKSRGIELVPVSAVMPRGGS